MTQVEQVHTLVDQLTAARARRLGTPLAVVAETSTVPVARAQMHELAVTPGLDLLGGARDPRVEAVVEPDLDHAMAGAPAFDQAIDLAHRHARGLLHEHMRTGEQRLLGQLREMIVGGRHDDDLGAHGEQLLQRGARSGAIALGETASPLGVHVVAGEQDVVRRRAPRRAWPRSGRSRRLPRAGSSCVLAGVGAAELEVERQL